MRLVVVDKHHPGDQEISDDDPAQFEGVYFDHVRYGQQKNRSLTVANTGRVTAKVSLVERPTGAGQTAGIAPTWLTLRMNHRLVGTSESGPENTQTLEPGDVCNIDLHLRILDAHLVRALNDGTKQLDDILVLRVENGRDHFIPVRGKWLESSLGRSIDKLIRIPEGGIRKLQRQRPDDSKARAMDEELPVKWSAPRELFRLTEAAENLTEACIAEWSMTASDQSPPWIIAAGWPFSAESWSALDDAERHDGFASISEALDTNDSIEGNLPAEYTKSQRLGIVASFFMSFLNAFPDGIVTETLWQEVEKAMISFEHDKKPAPEEEQRTSLQEILSQSPAHSISFILVTTMLDRIVREVVSTSDQNPNSKTVQLSGLLGRRGPWSKKSLSKDPATAFRQSISLSQAKTFAEAMIRAPVPTKDKDKAILEERKIRFVDLFLPKDLA